MSDSCPATSRAFVRTLKNATGSDIRFIGGGQINTVMLNDGLIDEIIVTIVPLVLRDGAPLFSPAAERSQFKTVGCETHETGQIQSRMIKE